MTSWRPADLARLAAGIADLALPATMAGAELGSRPLPRDLVIYRVLGARQVLQAVVTARTGWGALGAAVDLAHLASMLPVVALSPRWRRAAAVQAGVACVFALAGLRRA